MTDTSDRPGLFAELKRRNVVRVAILYAVSSWLVLQVGDVLFGIIEVPDWSLRMVAGALLLGFPIALVFAWVFEITPEGIRRETELVDRPDLAHRGQRLNIVIIVLLVLVLAVVLVDDRSGTAQPSPPGAASVIPTIAVLPFENRSIAGEEAAFFADGLHEDLINKLSRVPGLKVISRTSVMRYRKPEIALSEIAAELKAGAVLEGSVQRAGDRLRINVQFIDPADDQPLWAERFDRGLTTGDIFSVQGEIVAAIANALQLRFARSDALFVKPAQNMEAYDAYLRGRRRWDDWTVARVAESIEFYRRALEIDPDYALAWGAMAESYVWLSNSGAMPPSEAIPQARQAAERALELDPQTIEALVVLAEIAFHHDWDYNNAELRMLRAFDINPNYAVAYTRHAGHMAALGRFDEALAAEMRAIELSPSQIRLRGELAYTFITAGRIPDALATAERALARHPELNDARATLGLAQFLSGDQATAIETLQHAVAGDHAETRPLATLGWAYGRAGRLDEARAVAAQLDALAAERPVSSLDRAIIAIGMNDTDRALNLLGDAIAERNGSLPFIGTSPLYEPLRGDSRFDEILATLGLPL